MLIFGKTQKDLRGSEVIFSVTDSQEPDKIKIQYFRTNYLGLMEETSPISNQIRMIKAGETAGTEMMEELSDQPGSVVGSARRGQGEDIHGV